GQPLKIEPLTDEDRRTIVRWIDLGCPIDLDYGAVKSGNPGVGWMGDEARPTLTVTYPAAGSNVSVSRILVGAYDYFSGLDPASLRIVADVPIDDMAAGKNLATRFTSKSLGVWEWVLRKPMSSLSKATLTVSIKDRQGNLSRVDRVFSVGAASGSTAR